MRILHTGDWHIGKLVHGLHMTEDQQYLLKELMELLEREKVDVLIIAGDVYDRSIPPTEAVELLDGVLSKVVMELGIKVLVVSGNHDSADRLDFGSRILKDRGLYIQGRLKKDISPITLEDEFGPVNFYLVPYADPAVIKAVYGDPSISSHDDGAKAVLEPITEKMNPEQRNVCISHGFVAGSEDPETSESERPLSIGGSEVVSAKHYTSFDYTALGHLHRPQKILKDSIRYSGSLLKYSFSEANQKKSVTLVDLKDKGDITVEERILSPRRDLRVIKGELEELLKEEVVGQGNREDYIQAILTDREKLFEPMQKLRSVYPNVLQMEKEHKEYVSDTEEELEADIKHKKPEELFVSFYQKVTGEESLSEEGITLFSEIYGELQQEERDL